MRRQGKVTVKYDCKELRKHLNLEEWILEQLTRLYDCQEEEIPELEIEVDELLDMESDDTWAARVKELLVDCYKPTEAFISGLLDKIRDMQWWLRKQRRILVESGILATLGSNDWHNDEEKNRWKNDSKRSNNWEHNLSLFNWSVLHVPVF